MTGTPLQYHASLFEIIRENPIRSRLHLRLLEIWEKQEKFQLPPAVREWYSLEIPRLFQPVRFKTKLHWYPLEVVLRDLSQSLRDSREEPSPTFPLASFPRDKETPVEVVLDGSVDPLVRPGFESNEDSFSQFLLKAGWGAGTEMGTHFEPTRWPDDIPFLCAREPFGPAELCFLKQNFLEGPHTIPDLQNSIPSDPNLTSKAPAFFRFYNKQANILIQCENNSPTESTSACWMVRGSTSQTLLLTVCFLRNCGTLGKTLQGWTKAGKTVIQKLHS